MKKEGIDSMLKTMKNGKKGFTLVELVVVIAILAILAAVAIPTISGLITDANKATDAANAQTVEVAIKTNMALVSAHAEGASGITSGVSSGTIATLLSDSSVKLNSSVLTPKYSSNHFYYNTTTGQVTAATSAPTGSKEITTSTTLGSDGAPSFS